MKPLMTPVKKPVGSANLFRKWLGIRNSGLERANEQYIIRAMPSIAVLICGANQISSKRPRNTPGACDIYRGQNWLTVILKLPAWLITSKLLAIDGMIKKGSVGLRPKIRTSRGKQVVENPSPVKPFVSAAIK